MGDRLTRRDPRVASAEPSPAVGRPSPGRSWLSHGLAALAVSALGIAVAASTSVVTSAEPTGTPADLPRATVSTAPVAAPGLLSPPGQAGRSAGEPSQPPVSGSLRAFGAAPRTAAEGGDDGVRQAVVGERAAQRSEDLLKDSEDTTRVARDKSSAVRSTELAAADRAARENAVKIAESRLRRAVASRVAAQLAREQAEGAAAAATARQAAERAEQAVQEAQQAQREAAPATSRQSAARSAPERERSESEPKAPSGGGSASPVPGAVVGAGFGQTGLWARYHTGLDFRAGHGTPIKAVKSGVVVFAGNSGTWAGNHIAIKHADGMTTHYAHLSGFSVRTGQTVDAGRVIGSVGATGRAFGAHLHFELYPEGTRYGDVYRAVNPVPWLRAAGIRTR